MNDLAAVACAGGVMLFCAILVALLCAILLVLPEYIFLTSMTFSFIRNVEKRGIVGERMERAMDWYWEESFPDGLVARFVKRRLRGK